MKVSTFLTNALRKVSGKLLGATALASIFTVSIMSAGATAPAFNNVANDYPTLQVAQPNQPYSTATTAHIGDQLTGFVWDHQTVPNTIAHNTTVKVVLPTTASNTLVSTATVSADNASNTAHGTTTVNVDASARLVYVPGSAQLLRNIGGTMQVVNWMSGVNPDSVISTGVNLGDQAGCNCFQYVQAIRYQVRVEGIHPVISTNKKVEVAGGSAGFADSVTTSPANDINYRVFLQNTGDGTGFNPRISDTLDPHFTYVPNSSWMLVKRNNQDVRVNIPDSAINFNGHTITWAFDDMAPRPDAALYLNFQTHLASADQFPVGTTDLTNTAQATYTGVNATTNTVTTHVVRQADNVVSFTIRKEVTNSTLADSKWYNRDQLAAAKPGDELTYRLSITNTGNIAATNVNIKDILPAGETFDGSVMLFDPAHPNGVSINNNDLVNNGYVIANLGNGNANEDLITFKAKVNQNVDGTPILVNRAQVIYAGQVKAEDNAGVIVSNVRGLIIVKLIQDPKTGEFKHDIGEVAPGSTLVYRITVQNNGTTWANSPVLRDVAPTNATYIANSLTVDDEVMSQDIQNAFFSQGFILTSLNPGHGKTVYVKFKVNGCPLIKTDLINTAFVKADSVPEISDTAKAFENICASPTPTPSPTPPTTPTPTPPTTPKPTPTPVLPKTGPEAEAFLIVGMSGAAATVSRYYYLKNQLKKSLRNIHIA